MSTMFVQPRELLAADQPATVLQVAGDVRYSLGVDEFAAAPASP